MDPDVETALRSLEQAQAKLEAKLRESETFRSLEAIRSAKTQLLAEVGVASTSLSLSPPVTRRTASPRSRIERRQSRRVSGKTNKSELYRNLAHELCEQTDKRVTSRTIVNLLIERGYELADPKMTVRSVSSALSADPSLQNTGDSHGVGYGPSEWSVQSSETSAHTVGEPIHAKEGYLLSDEKT